MALYPDTSCFYRAEVIASPRDLNAASRVSSSLSAPVHMILADRLLMQGGQAAKQIPMYKLKFEDDDDQEHMVQAMWVVEWPGKD